MTELAELVHIGAFGEEKWECPFSHKKDPPPDQPNVMPPVDGKDKNDATKLGNNLDAESAGMEIIQIQCNVGGKAKPFDVQYTPHHLIPGNESWPETKLLRWVDKRDGHVNSDISYDINDASNGVDLPGIHGIGSSSWSSKSPNFQTQYAFAAMAASSPKRQFHDRHPKYSAYVVNVLDAIAEKLDSKEEPSLPGCGKKHCGGSKEKPYDPPVGLLTRLESVARRLEGHLTGSEDNWQMPIFTSRFALMYKEKGGMTQDEARTALSDFEV